MVNPKTVPLLRERVTQAASMLRMLGNERRLAVLCLLVQYGELNVGELLRHMPDLGQSALSQHLARMRQENLVTFRREAQTLYYRIQNPDAEKVMRALEGIFCP